MPADGKFEDDPVLFAQQVTELVNAHLSEDGQLLFSHAALTFGYTLLAISIAKVHGLDRAAFERVVAGAWAEQEKTLTCTLVE